MLIANGVLEGREKKGYGEEGAEFENESGGDNEGGVC